jgi:hypothetical protein
METKVGHSIVKTRVAVAGIGIFFYSASLDTIDKRLSCARHTGLAHHGSRH